MYASYQQSLAPVESAATGLLQHLNKDELQKVLDDDQKLEGLIRDVSQVKNLADEKETLLASIKSVAEYNMSRQPRLDTAKNQLAQAYEKAVEVQKSYEQTKQKLDFYAAQQNLDTTLALLQTRAATSEEDSEELAESFLRGDTEADHFLQNYISERKVAHVRRVKVEKMKELVTQRNTSAIAAGVAGVGVSNNWNNPPYGNYSSAVPNHNNFYP